MWLGDQRKQDHVGGECGMCGTGYRKRFSGTHGGRSAFGRTRCRLETNISMDAKEKFECVDWNHVVQGREKWRSVVNAVMNGRVA